MPTYTMTGPDGKDYSIDGPAGASQDQVIAAIQANMKTPIAASPQKQTPSNLGVSANATSKLVASIPDALLNTPNNLMNLGKAAFGSAAGALGRPDLMPELTPNPDLAHKAMTAMGFIKPQFEPQTTGQRLLDAGVQGAGGMLLSPANSARQIATNLAIGGASGLASQGTKEATGNDALAIAAGLMAAPTINKAVDYGQSKAQQMAALKSQNAPRDQVIENAKAAGYVLSPSEVNPSTLNHALEGIAGKLSTRQLASQENQPVTNSLARQAVGLPPDAALTSEAMQAIRKKAFQDGYAPIDSAGTFMPGRQYKQDLNDLQAKYEGAARSFPSAVNDDVANLVKSLKVRSFDAGDAIKMTQILRGEADSAFRAGDTAIAQAKKGAAKAIEDQIERGLQGQGQAGAQLLSNFRDARTLMAKAHTVEDAIREGGGNVVASKLAARLQAGKPLSGELKTIAETANIFPKNTQSPEMMGAVPGISPLDVMGGSGLGVLGAIATGNPLGAVLGMAPAIRPVTRNMLLSDTYQKNMAKPSYDVSALAKFLSKGDAQPGNQPLNAALIGALLSDQSLRNK